MSKERQAHLEFLKLLLVFAALSFADLEHVETHCLTEWTTLTHCHHITKANIPKMKQWKQL